jgi:hypothetical protein
MMFHKRKQKFTTSILSVFFILSMVLAPVSTTLEVQRAEALGGVGDIVQDPWNLVKNTITSIAAKAQLALTDSLVVKEYALDTLAWALVNIFLEKMIQSTTAWINSGFEGEPAFITDMDGWLTDIADRVAGDFIWNNTDLAFLCSPFALDVKFALDLQYRQSRDFETECRITDMVDNFDAFLEGDFLSGGWDGWFATALNRHNNPYGAALEASIALDASLENAKRNELKLADYGRGFLTRKECAMDAGGKERCTNITPGVTIEDTLNQALSIPGERLTIADELDEMIAALLAQLASNVLEGDGGLLGLTNNKDSDGYNYFDRVEQAPPITQDRINYGDLFIPGLSTTTRNALNATSSSTTLPGLTGAGFCPTGVTCASTSWPLFESTLFTLTGRERLAVAFAATSNNGDLSGRVAAVAADIAGSGSFNDLQMTISSVPGDMSGSLCTLTEAGGSAGMNWINSAGGYSLDSEVDCVLLPGRVYYINIRYTGDCEATERCSFYLKNSYSGTTRSTGAPEWGLPSDDFTLRGTGGNPLTSCGGGLCTVMNWPSVPRFETDIPAVSPKVYKFVTTPEIGLRGSLNTIITVASGMQRMDQWVSATPGGEPISTQCKYTSNEAGSLRWVQAVEPSRFSCVLDPRGVYYWNIQMPNCTENCHIFLNASGS